MEGFVPWPPEFARRYRQEGYWLDKTITEVMEESFERFASNPLLVAAQNGRVYSYQECGRLATRLALHLKSLGLKLYDRVILQLPNQPEVLITYLAILKAGGIPIMALPPHQEAEIGFFAKLAEARALVIPAVFRKADKQQMAENIQKEAPSLDMVLVSGGKPRPGYYSLDALFADPIEERIKDPSFPRPDPDLPAVLQLSGGTTGIPKLIPRTHNDYIYNFLCNARVCGLDGHTVLLLAIPQQHNFALACPGFMGVASAGGCEVLSAVPSPDAALEVIEKYRVTHWIAVPAMVIAVLNHPDRSRYHLESLKIILTGGSKLNPEVALRVRPELGCDVQQCLGMAEGPLFWTRLDDPDEVRFGTQGRPQSPGDDFKIADPSTGEEVESGEMGELWCRGPYTIRGYYRAPEYNARAFSPDGYYKSGDLVRLHTSGNVVVEGRLKDCINRGGEKISAEEIENHILAHPAVDICACVAMPDLLLGERVCAFIVPKPGQALTLAELNRFLLEERRIAKFKLPERLELVDALPLTNVGKVNKVVLRNTITEQIEKEGAQAAR
ncbi:(2,3-dihydroxybenzoyl)adenylate synthase [Desulfatiglans anilini]|uniref:(2,3-dihydroxybenzoyl)adenylate synthase n=1 Tax=Desulfatiglans anilini TaxID=90728 RepID=UPI000417F71B|nr:AMP-binding protein [Desulfatiglans anilini]